MRLLSVFVCTSLLAQCLGFMQNVIPSTKVRPSKALHISPIYEPTLIYSSKLYMNVVEDFLSGTDKTARKAENDKYIATLMKRVTRINELEATIEELADDELVGKSNEFRKRLSSGEDINGPILEEAFAVVREAAW